MNPQNPTEQQAAFLAWLKQKSPRDYWYYPDAPADFALQYRQQLLTQLANQSLSCEHVIWHMTNRCNLRCLHCGVSGGEKVYSELSTADFLNKMPELLALGLKALTLSGGEPFLRKDIFTVIQACRAAGVKVAAVSNGHFLSRDLTALEKTPLDSLSISLDGLAGSHNYLRASEHSYQKVIEAIQLAAQIPIPIVNVNTSVYPANFSELPAIREVIFAAGANHWVLRPVAMSGRARQHALRIDSEQILALLHFAEDSVKQGYDVSVEGLGYLGPWDSILSLVPYFSHAGWNSFYVLPDGNIKGFHDEQQPIEGHLLDDNLAEIWFSGFQSYRFPEYPELCGDCPFWSACGGGNLAEAESGWRCIREVIEPFALSVSA